MSNDTAQMRLENIHPTHEPNASEPINIKTNESLGSVTEVGAGFSAETSTVTFHSGSVDREEEPARRGGFSCSSSTSLPYARSLPHPFETTLTFLADVSGAVRCGPFPRSVPDAVPLIALLACDVLPSCCSSPCSNGTASLKRLAALAGTLLSLTCAGEGRGHSERGRRILRGPRPRQQDLHQHLFVCQVAQRGRNRERPMCSLGGFSGRFHRGDVSRNLRGPLVFFLRSQRATDNSAPQDRSAKKAGVTPCSMAAQAPADRALHGKTTCKLHYSPLYCPEQLGELTTHALSATYRLLWAWTTLMGFAQQTSRRVRSCAHARNRTAQATRGAPRSGTLPTIAPLEKKALTTSNMMVMMTAA